MKLHFLIPTIVMLVGADLPAQDTSAAASVAPVPKATPAAPRSANYHLCPSDVLAIKVFREPDLDSQRRISKDGTIDFPLIGTVQLAGKTTTEAAGIIATLLDKDYLVKPQVAVDVVIYAKQHFNVIGQVARPGTFDLPEEATIDLTAAIAQAGGFTRLADLAHVVVHRQTGEHFVVDYRPLTKDRMAKSVPILPNDTIHIGERLF